MHTLCFSLSSLILYWARQKEASFCPIIVPLTYNIVNKERLLKLADHLEHGKLGHKVFDYTKWNWNDRNKFPDARQVPEYSCGTNGCAIGEMPILEPEEWEFDSVGLPQLKNGIPGYKIVPSPLICAARWFDITMSDAMALFAGDKECAEHLGINPLKDTTTKEQVAATIRYFVNSHTIPDGK